MTQRTPQQMLLGSWQSDHLRTFRHWKPSGRSTPAQIRKLKSLFGKLVVRWTPKRCYTSFDDFVKGEPYEVVAADEDSLVLRMPRSEFLGGGQELLHIHFDLSGDRYWMAVNWSQGFVEWFKRVP